MEISVWVKGRNAIVAAGWKYYKIETSFAKWKKWWKEGKEREINKDGPPTTGPSCP